MKLFIRIFTLIMLLTNVKQVIACSLVDIPSEELKSAMITHIATAVSQAINKEITDKDIAHTDLTDPSVIFLDGLGPMCEGLDNAIRTSIFEFTKDFEDGMRCEFTGIVIMRGYSLNSSNMKFHTKVEKIGCIL